VQLALRTLERAATRVMTDFGPRDISGILHMIAKKRQAGERMMGDRAEAPMIL
jgi:hypothetical protein